MAGVGVRWVGLGLAMLLLAGCGATQPGAAPVAAGPAVRITDWMPGPPNLYHEPLITDDLPTFAPIGDRPWAYPGPGLTLPQFQEKADPQAVFAAIAASIDKTGKPDVPDGQPAAFGGKLEDETYIYQLAGIPLDGADGRLVYMLRHQPEGWTATPICRRAWGWVWPGTLTQQHDPVTICAYIEGSGAVLNLAAYKGARQVLTFAGLEDSYVSVVPAPDGGVPTIVAYGGYHWLDHKADATVLERYTFTWQDGAYALTKVERQADWVYHLARLIGFLAKDEPEQAAGEFAAPPPGGVKAYLQRNAHDLPGLAAGRWSTERTAAGGKQVYLHPAPPEAGPWFSFFFDADGRITAVGQQPGPPKS